MSKLQTTNVPNHEERRVVASDSRSRAKVWRTVRAAYRISAALKSVGKGVYEVSPELVLALRHACEEVGPILRQHDADLLEDARK